MTTQSSLHFKAMLATSTACLIAGGLFTQPALAQEQTADAQPALEAIIVTGSRIARPDLTSNSPITVVTGELLQEQGVINVEQALNQLPQITPGLNANVNNGGNGTVAVDLRGLRPERTLVLVNGRRMVPSNNTGVVDLNVINPLLIKRVDVVTGGTSATYGSDALGGVVNFVLKDKFEGVELTGQYGLTSRGDSQNWNLGGVIGGGFADEKGHMTIAASYNKRSPSFQSEREWSRIDQNGGSATGVTGRLDNSFANPFNAGTSTAGGNWAFNKDGSVRRFRNNFDLTDPTTDRYNFAPVNYIQTPQERFTITALGDYEIAENIKFFVEASYVSSEVKLQLAPTPATNILVDPDSPVLSASARALADSRSDPNADLIFRRRMVEVGPRIQTYNFDVTQLNAGLKGTVQDKWSYELYYGRGRVDSAQGLQNDVSRSRLTAGLNGCPANSPAGCVVVDAFGEGRISKEAADYIRISSAVDQFKFNRDNVVASVTGDLPGFAAGPVGVSVGAEYRKDASDFIPSDPAQTGDLTGFNAVQPISGSFDVKEIFGEMSIPLVANKPFMHRLTLDIKARYSDYSTVGGAETYSVGGEWMPISDLRFRSLYSKATRAPSVFELFQAGDQGFPVVVDPCFRGQPSGTAPAPSDNVARICQLQGLPDPRTNILTQTNSQIESTSIGSEDLDSETADTITAGVQFTPSAVPTLSLGIDYFNIKVDGYISRIAGGASGLVSKCFQQNITTLSQLNADPYCSLLSRRPTGELLVTVPLTNEEAPGVNNVLKTSGIDFTFAYTQDLTVLGLDGSRLALMANVTRLEKYDYNGTDYSGLSSADFGTLPKWTSNARVTYMSDQWSLSVNWQRLGKAKDTFGDVLATEDYGNIKAQNYIDLNASATVADTFQIFAGIQNLFDKQPPAVNSGYTATNTDEYRYDTLGRRFFVGTKITF